MLVDDPFFIQSGFASLQRDIWHQMNAIAHNHRRARELPPGCPRLYSHEQPPKCYCGACWLRQLFYEQPIKHAGTPPILGWLCSAITALETLPEPNEDWPWPAPLFPQYLTDPSSPHPQLQWHFQCRHIMGACASSPNTTVHATEFERHFNPRFYHGNDSYLQCYVAVLKMFQEWLVNVIGREGYDAARFPSPAVFTYDTETILHSLQGSSFSVLYNFVVELGLTLQVLLELQGEDKDWLWACSMSACKDIDWIMLFLSKSAKLKCISTQCDLTIHNFGCMLVVAPQLFHYCDQGSLSSTLGQSGSISNLRPIQDGQDGSHATCIYAPDDPNVGVQQWPGHPVIAQRLPWFCLHLYISPNLEINLLQGPGDIHHLLPHPLFILPDTSWQWKPSGKHSSTVA